MSLIPFTPAQLANIKSLGLELEGGYCSSCVNPIFAKYIDDLHLEDGVDYTVVVHFQCSKHPLAKVDYHAEIRVWAERKDLPKLFSFVDELFASGGFKQNRTCGNHIHIMFTDYDMWKNFSNRKTWDAFVEAYKQGFKGIKFKARLKNLWCAAVWDDRTISGYKYRMINFHSIEKNSTLEFRILPWFKDSEEAQHSYLSMLGIIDSMAGAVAH